MANIMDLPRNGSDDSFGKKLVKMPISMLEACTELVKVGAPGKAVIIETVNGSSDDAKTRAQAANRMLERVQSIDGFDSLKAVQRKDPNNGKIYIFVTKVK